MFYDLDGWIYFSVDEISDIRVGIEFVDVFGDF
jgi:hypothetical protein